MSGVAGHVAANLGQPVGLGGGLRELLFERGELALAELVTMPEVAIHEDGEARARNDDVGLARQVGGVDAVAEPMRPQRPAQRQLRRGISAMYLAHDRRDLVRRPLRRRPWWCLAHFAPRVAQSTPNATH